VNGGWKTLTAEPQRTPRTSRELQNVLLPAIIEAFLFTIHDLPFTAMFCPSCGTETTTGLNYCNRCGANLAPLLAPELAQVNLTRPATVIGVIMMFLTLGGFALLIAGARILASVISGNDPLIAVIFMGMLTILVVDIFLARQLSKLINAALSGTAKPTNRMASPVTAPQLPRPNTAPILQAPSVTENTTRFLESDYRAPVAPQPSEKQKT
jgi:hypothetical protein